MISYYGHTSFSADRANALLDQARAILPSETFEVCRLEPARPLTGPFDHAIARDFGIDAQSRFRLSLLDKEQAHRFAPQAVEQLYRLFGREQLVVTWELDSVIEAPPR